MKILAPAKINLYLNIVGKRKDGYHKIETIFQTVSLYDSLEIVARVSTPTAADPAIYDKAVQLAVLRRNIGGPKNHPQTDCPKDRNNIVWRAAELFFRKFKLSGKCKIALKKEIPIQAGLGGGSSDAAATLRGMAGLFLKNNLDRSKSEILLHQIALELGADVPFFLSGGCAQASGIGEKIARIVPAPKFWAVIVKPAVGLSTPAVYRWFDQDQNQFASERKSELTSPPDLNKIVYSIRAQKSVKDWSRCIYNCFESVVFKRVRELGKIKQLLIRSGAMNACLSGSGSALFGIASSRLQAERIKKRLKDSRLKSWIVHSI